MRRNAAPKPPSLFREIGGRLQAYGGTVLSRKAADPSDEMGISAVVFEGESAICPFPEFYGSWTRRYEIRIRVRRGLPLRKNAAERPFRRGIRRAPADSAKSRNT
ncbi:MAG: hypothetical protein ACLRSW_15950 [Christensenellaceae bacterium]